MIQPNNLVNILWTGGWDSTFRLLYLVLIEQRYVQPYYLIEGNRQSTQNELSAILRIRDRIESSNEGHSHLLLPTKIYLVSEIDNCQVITDKFRSLSNRFRIGSQFEWLPCFAEQHGLYDLELNIEINELRPRDSVFEHLGKFLIYRDGTYKLSDKCTDKDLTIFKYFHFPLFFTTKLQMMQSSKDNSFFDYMLESWFCHKPLFNKPCGTCHPCIDAIEEGLSFRLPLLAKFRYQIKKHVNYIKRLKFVRYFRDLYKHRVDSSQA